MSNVSSDLPAHAGSFDYDVIVVGARCAGSPTAMLLARQGHRVLLIDRATFPSDSMRAHLVRGGGSACLARWGLLDRVLATNCPPIRRTVLDLGDGPLSQPVAEREAWPVICCPRRYALDALLLDAAAEAGVVVEAGCRVEALLWEDDRVVGIRARTKRGQAIARARLVVGADGLHSFVARAVGAPTYRGATPAMSCCYYGYFADVPLDADEIAFVADRFLVAAPTNDGLALVAVAAPIAEFAAFRADIETSFYRSFDRAPWLAERIAGGRRVERWRGTADLPNFFRRPQGPGWALVGDAGYHQDPITAQGISNAFIGADLL
ncbi:MAG TPA: NAD(P)/FAD-dependent oxidoreductase, partial [Thermomicrobiales bacterium]|nr:NAD(P)/FAD-dependent oxidoreductase [Thermomicrobiales bacterium]